MYPTSGVRELGCLSHQPPSIIGSKLIFEGSLFPNTSSHVYGQGRLW